MKVNSFMDNIFDFASYKIHVKYMKNCFDDAFECSICGMKADKFINITDRFEKIISHLICSEQCEKYLFDLFESEKIYYIDKMKHNTVSEYKNIDVIARIGFPFFFHNNRTSIYLSDKQLRIFALLIFKERNGNITNKEKRALLKLRLKRNRADLQQLRYSKNNNIMSSPFINDNNIPFIKSLFSMGYAKIKLENCHTITNPTFIGIDDDFFIEVNSPIGLNTKARCWHIINVILNHTPMKGFIGCEEKISEITLSEGVTRIYGRNAYIKSLFKKQRHPNEIEILKNISFIITKDEYNSTVINKKILAPLINIPSDFDINLVCLTDNLEFITKCTKNKHIPNNCNIYENSKNTATNNFYNNIRRNIINNNSYNGKRYIFHNV